MICACPACGRRTEIDGELGDFPTRCVRCGAMVRVVIQRSVPTTHPAPRMQTSAAKTAGTPAPASPASPTRRLPLGGLAGLLSTKPPAVAAPPAAPTLPAADFPVCKDKRKTDPSPSAHPSPTPDQLDLARATARLKALRRAELLGNFEALGVVSKAAFSVAILLAVLAATLGLRSMLHASPVRADVLQMSRGR